MNFKKRFADYQKTTDNKTYKLCHYAHEDMCCLACVNRRRDFYFIHETDGEKGKIPNWKLVSKNRKQWMKKPLKYTRKAYSWSKICYHIIW